MFTFLFGMTVGGSIAWVLKNEVSAAVVSQGVKKLGDWIRGL